MLTCTKRFADIPAAPRQHTHAGHCRFIHGHNWAFEFEFIAKELDACGFVIDFGGSVMKGVKQWINDTFDHKLILNESDPLKFTLHSMLGGNKTATHDDGSPFTDKLADIVVLPDGSAEGLALYLFLKVNERVQTATNGRVLLKRVTVLEDEKNSATFAP